MRGVNFGRRPRGNGATSWPAWRDAIAAGTWGIVTTHELADIDPGVAPNDVTPSGADWERSGMTGGLLSWVGGCWDEEGSTFHIPVGGGHKDYGGNEPYQLNVNAAAPLWVMVRPPSGHSGGPAITANDGQEDLGVYSDGRIRAQHTYNNPVFIPGAGPAVGRSTAHFFDGGSHIRKCRVFDADGESSVLADYTALSGAGNGEGAAAFDPTRGAGGTVWSLGSGTSTLVQIDVDAGTGTNRGAADNWLRGCGAMVYIPAADVAGGDVLACYPDGRGSNGLAIRSLSAYTAAVPSLSGSFSAGFAFTLGGTGFGFTWNGDDGYLALWNNATDRTEISTLTPSDPADLSQPWVRGTLTVAPGNSVTPGAPDATGTFSRFWYSRRFRAFFLVPSTESPTYCFAVD